MALVKCTECGREISEKAESCPNCGCPIETRNRLSKAEEVLRERKKLLLPIFAVIGVIIIIGVVASMLNKNAFSPYLKYLGKSYKEIPKDYEMMDIIEGGVKGAQKATKDIFGVPGEITMFALYDEEKGDFGDVYYVSWSSKKEDKLTKSDIEAFKNGMKKIYGNWDEVVLRESEYDFLADSDVYLWKAKDGYNISLNISTDLSKLTVSWGFED